MGNNQETNINESQCKFNMQIFLNKYNFFPDETIKGEIKLSLKDENSVEPPTLISPKIIYRLIHKESFNNPEILDNKNKNKSNENSIIEEDDSIKQEVIFIKSENYPNIKNKDIKNISPISFSIKIPQNTKPSFEYMKNNNKIYGFSRIYLYIEIPESKNKKEILLFIQKNPIPLNSELTISKYLTKKKLGFIGSGSNINFQGSYPKNYFGFGDICPLNISLDIFGSKENIKSITFILKRKISFMKNKTKIANEFIEDLWQHYMKENLSQRNLYFNIPMVENEKYFNERKNNFFDINTTNKENLICLLPSYDGQLIKCQYYILIKISYESLLITNPEFEMPIDLGHAQSIFSQICMLDINKILVNINNVMIKNLMPECDVSNNNKGQIDMKSKMKDIFGESAPKNKNDIKNKIFGNASNYNKPNNNKEIQNNSEIKGNLNDNGINKDDDLPSENEVYTIKDEQAAPGLDKKD